MKVSVGAGVVEAELDEEADDCCDDEDFRPVSASQMDILLVKVSYSVRVVISEEDKTG